MERSDLLLLFRVKRVLPQRSRFFAFFRGRYLIPKRKSKYKNTADYLKNGHILAKNYDRNENRYQRVDIAEYRRFLPCQLLKRREVQAVGNARVNKSHHQKANNALCVKTSEIYTACKANVRY